MKLYLSLHLFTPKLQHDSQVMEGI